MDEVQVYVNSIKGLLGLEDWQITIIDQTTENPETLGCTHTVLGQKRASIHFREDFFSWTRRKQLETIVHELFHLHLDSILRNAFFIEEYLNPAVWNMWFKGFREALEVAVDSLAVAFVRAGKLPRPTFPTGR